MGGEAKFNRCTGPHHEAVGEHWRTKSWTHSGRPFFVSNETRYTYLSKIYGKPCQLLVCPASILCLLSLPNRSRRQVGLGGTRQETGGQTGPQHSSSTPAHPSTLAQSREHTFQLQMAQEVWGMCKPFGGLCSCDYCASPWSLVVWSVVSQEGWLVVVLFRPYFKAP